jgi:hypothetical protein
VHPTSALNYQWLKELEGILAFDAVIDLLLPVFAFGNALPVDPGVQVVCGQGLYDLLGEVQVFAGVGDEDVEHVSLPH